MAYVKGIVCVWLVVMAIVTTNIYAETVPTFTCSTSGIAFHCIAQNAKQYLIAPLWILHQKRQYQVYGNSLNIFKAPKHWSLLEMRIPVDDQSDTPYDSTRYTVAKAWVRICNNRAVFAYYHEGITPPKCGQKLKN